jgi:hypothetical protein
VLAPFSYAQIISAVILGIAIFGATPDGWTILGIVMIIGLASMSRCRRRRVRERRQTRLGALGDAADGPLPGRFRQAPLLRELHSRRDQFAGLQFERDRDLVTDFERLRLRTFGQDKHFAVIEGNRIAFRIDAFDGASIRCGERNGGGGNDKCGKYR